MPTASWRTLLRRCRGPSRSSARSPVIHRSHTKASLQTSGRLGRELGVRYVLEGSVRKAGNRIRIAGQLIDATSGSHVWADRFESDLGDIFELQDHVTSSVVGAIAPSLELAEIARARQKAGSLLAYDYYLRSLAAFYRFTRKDHEEALSLLQKAIGLDPEFALAHAIKSHWHHGVRKSSGWIEDEVGEKLEAERLARRALELDRNDPRVLANVGATLWWGLGRHEEGVLFSIKRSKLILTMRWRGVWLAALQWLLAASMMRSNIARVPSA